MTEKAIKILNESIIWDNAIVWAERLPNRLASLEEIRTSGVTAVSIKINANDGTNRGTLTALAKERVHFKAFGDKYIVAKTPEDIMKAKKEKKLAITFCLADSQFIENPDSDTEMFSALGVTHIVLSSVRNVYADSCYEFSDTGLSNSGRALIKQMNKGPILIDGTLGGYRTTMEAMALSEKPFVFTHTNVFSLCKNARNIKDDQIKACAQTGGVIGLTFLGGYLGNPIPDAETLFRQIDHICTLTGPAHVGIGSNYTINPTAFFQVMNWARENGMINDSYENCGGDCFKHAELPKLIDLLISHGYQENDIAKILGLNWLNLYHTALERGEKTWISEQN